MMNGDDMGGGGEDADFNQAGISRSGLGNAGELSSASMVVVVHCTKVVHCKCGAVSKMGNGRRLTYSTYLTVVLVTGVLYCMYGYYRDVKGSQQLGKQATVTCFIVLST
jgi:hypothetical protein